MLGNGRTLPPQPQLDLCVRAALAVAPALRQAGFRCWPVPAPCPPAATGGGFWRPLVPAPRLEPRPKAPSREKQGTC